MTGNLTSAGVTTRQLLDRIIALEKQVRALQQGAPAGPAGPTASSPSPQISVINEGSGAHSVFVVSGSGFAPSRTVTIRVVDAALTVRNIPQSSGPDGKLGARLSIPCISGGILHFSATDSRPSSQDLTGVIWSNTFSTTCT